MSEQLAPRGAPAPPWMLAAASYLARYSGSTRETYRVSLRLLFAWCTDYGLDPLAAKRVHLELFLRYLEEERRCIPRSVAHHLVPVIGYYRFAVVDGYLATDPTVMLRRPRVFIPVARPSRRIRGAPEPAPGTQTSPASWRWTATSCAG